MALRADDPADRRARAVDARGPVGAPVLVLLHGTRRTRAMWQPQLQDLSDTFRVLTVDLPGHGALAEVPFRLADASAMIGSVIDDAGGRAIVIGQSLGAYVGLDLAAADPGRVAGLVMANASAEPRSIARRAPRTVGSYLLAAAGERVRGPGGGAGEGSRRARAGDGGTVTGPEAATGSDAGAAAEARVASDAGAGAGSAAEAAGSEATVPATNGWLFKGGLRALVAALGESFIPRLAAYPGPTLLVNGEQDHLFRHGEHAFLAAAVDGRLEVIPGCGHLVSEDQPAAFNAVVRRFAAEVHGRDTASARG